MGAPVITFLSDYGLSDDFVGICHGVIVQGCPEARIIDLAHGIAPHDVGAGALTLARALPYLPVAVHLAVVDPGVGGARRAVALRAGDGRAFVGPDNGLLHPAAVAAGGIEAAVDLADTPFARTPVSATFHGRDVFAPVAAALAGGAALPAVGRPVDPASVQALDLPGARVDGDELVTHVVAIDRFGNLQLDASAPDLASIGAGRDRGASVTRGDRPPVALAVGRTFGDVAPGEPMLYEDAHRALAIAVNAGSAARRLAVAVGDELRVRSS